MLGFFYISRNCGPDLSFRTEVTNIGCSDAFEGQHLRCSQRELYLRFLPPEFKKCTLMFDPSPDTEVSFNDFHAWPHAGGLTPPPNPVRQDCITFHVFESKLDLRIQTHDVSVQGGHSAIVSRTYRAE